MKAEMLRKLELSDHSEPIGFKFSNGRKIEFKFSITATIQVNIIMQRACFNHFLYNYISVFFYPDGG